MTMSPNLDCSTILAVASGAGRAGIAVLRISGSRARFVAETVCGGLPQPRVASLRSLIDPVSGEVIDQGIVLFFPAPHSFTGEDVLELQVHGSLAVTRAMLRAITGLASDIRLAEPGEFSRRAFLNGRMDLAAIEGLGDLIDSETEWQRRQALRQMQGQLGALVGPWRESLIAAMASVEAELDFSDEGDVPADVRAGLHTDLHRIRRAFDDVLRSTDRGERLRSGYRVVIAGPPNAGKSSLLNAIARRDVALVSPVAGTTRDIIEVRCDIRGYPVLLADTAGLRDSADEVERMGIARARREIDAADVTLVLRSCDDSGPQDVSSLERVAIVVATKSDLATPRFAHDIAISTQRGQGIDTLLDLLGDRLEELGGGEISLVANERQRSALMGAAAALDRILGQHDLAGELLAEELRFATGKLDHLIGRVDHEAVLDVIFARFCIGK